MMLDLSMKCTRDDTFLISRLIILITDHFSNRLIDFNRLVIRLSIAALSTSPLHMLPSLTWSTEVWKIGLFVAESYLLWFLAVKSCLRPRDQCWWFRPLTAKN